MKSNADQIRMTAWLARPINRQVRMYGSDQATTKEATSASSKAT